MNKSNRGRPKIKSLDGIGGDLDTRRPRFNVQVNDPALIEATTNDGGVADDDNNYTATTDLGGA